MSALEANAIEGVEGLLVVELAEGIAGPFCGVMLAEMGARVIKIEPPDGDWSRTTGPPWVSGESPLFLEMNRGKESFAVDLRSEDGLAAVRALMLKADVVIQGYRPGVADRYGLGPAIVGENERLVYCSISGYGNRGPRREQPGSDTILQGYAGVMSVTGEPDGPPMRVGTALADTSCGVYALTSILALLLRRTQTGRGGEVDTSLLESLMHLQTTTFASFAAGKMPERLGTRTSLSAVPAELFRTGDGYIMVSCHGARQWRRLCTTLGHPEWIEDPRMASNESRVTNHDEVVALLGEALSEDSSEAWLERLEEGGVNAGPIQTFEQLAEDPQMQALRQLRRTPGGRYESFGYVSPPFTIDNVPDKAFDVEPPALGEHTDAILAELESGATRPTRSPRSSR